MTPSRILIVDDDPGMLRSMERVLGHEYEVVCARAAKEALGLADRSNFELAILDIRMPEMDGFALLSGLKAAHPDLDVILMTGSVHELDAQLIRALREKAFYFLQKPFDRVVLQTLVERCLGLRRLDRENRQHVLRLEKELADARAFQQSLLPPEQACVGGVSLCARYIPCVELGGDFYDYAAGPDSATVLVADVSGHGATAAMLTGVVKSAFHSAGVDGYEPRAIVERIATGIRAFGFERFITLVCVRVFTGRPALEYVSAGHPPALLWGPDRTLTFLESTGPLISPAFPNFSWAQETLDLRPDDRLLLYTDGIPETEGEVGMYGLERLVDVTVRNPSGGPRLLEEILQSVRAFSGGRPEGDDLTLLTVSLPGTSKMR